MGRPEHETVAGKPAGSLFYGALSPRAEAMDVMKTALDRHQGPAEADREARRLGFRCGDQARWQAFVHEFTARHGGFKLGA